MDRKSFSRIDHGAIDQSGRIGHIFRPADVSCIVLGGKTSYLVFTPSGGLLCYLWLLHSHDSRYPDHIVFFCIQFLQCLMDLLCRFFHIQRHTLFFFGIHQTSLFHFNLGILGLGTFFTTGLLHKLLNLGLGISKSHGKISVSQLQVPHFFVIRKNISCLSKF